MNAPLCRLLHAAVRTRVLIGFALGLTIGLRSASAQLYSQNFDSGTATNWTVASGTWQVSTGTDKTYNSTSLGAGPDISYYNGASWTTGYTYSADVRLYGSGSANETGVVYYYQDLNNYYEVELNPVVDAVTHTGSVRLLEHINSAAGTAVATGSFASTGGGSWHTVSVALSGTTTTIKIDGVTVITRTQTGLTGGGKIGVVDRWAGGWYNNVVVTDSQAPTVSITAPTNNSTMSATTTVTASASDNTGVAGVQFKLDGVNLGAEVTTSPYNLSWNTTTASNAQHVLTAVARDAAGNTTTSSGVTVTVNNATLPSPWQTQDIGTVGAAGSASYSSGTYTVAGAGAGIWWAADEFRFVYQAITGDCSITTRVVSVQNTGGAGGWEHGGIMVRESLNANAAFSGLYETATHGILFESRTATGATAGSVANDTSEPWPYWLKLVRSGNTFTASRSSDGVNWTVLGSQSITMASTVYVGLAVTSQVDATPGTAVFDNLTAVAGDFTPPTVSVTAPADNAQVTGTVAVTASASDNVGVVGVQFKLDGVNLGAEDTSSPYSINWDTTTASNAQHVLTAVARDAAGQTTTSGGIFVTVNNGSMLPSPWATQDIGSVGAAGSASYSSGTYTVAGAGAGIWWAADEFRFVYQAITGDCSIITRVVSVQNTGGAGGWEHGGIMVRESLNPNAAFSGLYETATHGILFESRTSTGATAGSVANDTTEPWPYWLKLVRSGNLFTASRSSDGVNWTDLGSQSITMASTVYIGLAVTSQVDATPGTAVFDNVSVSTASSDTTAPTVSITAPTNSANVSGSISVTASASDNIGVAGVQFELDGASLAAEVNTSPYSVTWDTTTTSNGTHTLSAVARDAAGNTATSSPVSVTVNNSGSGGPPPTPGAYFENFDSGSAVNWTVVSGSWAVNSGSYGNSTSGSHTAIYSGTTWSTDYTLRASLRSGGTGSSAKAGLLYSYVDASHYYKLLLAADGSAQLISNTGSGETVVSSAAANSYVGYYSGSGNNPWVEVELVRSGTTTTVRANGSRLFNAVTQTVIDGKIGVTDSGNTSSYDNISVTPIPTVAYSEDLSDNSAQNWSSVSGTWAVAGNTYNLSSNGTHDYTLYGASGATWLTNYTYSVSVFSSLTGSTNKRGVIYNYVDANNYYEVLLNGAGTAEIKKVVGGVTTSQGSGVAYVGGGATRWVEIAILRNGANTTVNVNGRRVFTDISQGDLTTAGKIGLSASNDNAAKFDDIVVTNGLDPYKKTFPKIFGCYISGGSQPWYDSTYQQILAKHDFVLLGLYASWHGGGTAIHTNLQAVKSLNPNLVIAQYTDVMEEGVPPDSSAIPAIDAKLDDEVGPTVTGGTLTPNNWWALNTQAQQTHEGSDTQTATKMTNITYFVKPDAGGYRFPQWFSQWTKTNLFDLAPEFDILYEDNCLKTEPKDGVGTTGYPDWNRDGTTDSWTNVEGDLGNLNYRRGIASYIMKWGQLKPSYPLMGNVGGQWGLGGNPLGTGEYQYLFNAALEEAATGMGYSEESWAGWYTMMAGYRNLMDQTRWPHLVAFMARTTSTGSYVQAPTAGPAFPGGYAFARYSIASALLEDGYICTIGANYAIQQSYDWFDEFDLYLGHAAEPPVRTPLANGAFMRHFQNGLVIVNPRQNADLSNRTGSVTIDLTGQGYKHFAGTQDSTTNNGQAVTTIQVAAGDGIVLIK